MSKVFRDDSPLTLVNGTQHTTWFPRQTDLPPLADPDDCASEGGTFRDPAPARVPRRRPLFKTDEQMRADGWEPVSEWAVAKFIAGCLAAVLCLIVIAHVGARWVA